MWGGVASSSLYSPGTLVAGFGLTILFKAYGQNLLSAVGLTATLYHALNHAFFKSLLFLATGSVPPPTEGRRLGKLGGLLPHMLWVTWHAFGGGWSLGAW